MKRHDPDQLPLDPAELDRYFAGTAPVADQERVRRWLTAHPDREPLLESLRLAPGGDHPTPRALDVDALWRSARDRLPGSPKPMTRGHWWKVSVVGTLALGAMVAVLQLTSSLRGHEYVSAAGSRTTITLSDGSTLVLGPTSRLRVPADFGRSGRQVELQGEGLFRVVHNAQHPFAVVIGHTVVRDVGTTFMVREFPDDPDLQIAVTEGQVMAGAVPLMAGDMARITSGQIAVTRHTDVAAATVWVQGGLSFRGTPLPEVIRDLARTFDLDIRVADSSLLTQHITAAFGTESVDEVLAAIVLPMGAQVERHGRHVVIRRQSSPAEQPYVSPKVQPVIHIATIQESHE